MSAKARGGNTERQEPLWRPQTPAQPERLLSDGESWSLYDGIGSLWIALHGDPGLPFKRPTGRR